jgi:hypothetical protein
MNRLSKIIENQKGAMGLGSTLDTRHSDTNFTFAVHDARVHIETPRGIAEPFASKIN